MTLKNRHRIAALLAVIFGLVSIKEGGSVLLGLAAKEYTVLPWLVWYNVLLGFASVVVGIGIWKERAEIIKPATTILSLHGLVLMILLILFAFGESVSYVSIMAMLLRTSLWFAIVLLVKKR